MMNRDPLRRGAPAAAWWWWARAGALLLPLLLVALGEPARAQAAAAPSTPSAPHEALSFFEGSWTSSDARPEDEFREHCAWLAEGRRHMVCRSSWKTPGGRREGISIFSHDAASGEYRYHGFRPGGAVVTQLGQRLPQGWRFSGEQGVGADRVRTRVTIERLAPDRFSFLSEIAKGDGPWQLSARCDYLRLGP